MKPQHILQIFRTACGTTIMIVHMLTGINGTAVVASLFLLGVPFEQIRGS